MSKEKILEEFELKLHNVYATIFQLSGYDDKQLKEKMYTMTSFLSKAIDKTRDQTREETIREVEEILPKEISMNKEYCKRCGLTIPKERLSKSNFCSDVCNLMPSNFNQREATIFRDGYNFFLKLKE